MTDSRVEMFSVGKSSPTSATRTEALFDEWGGARRLRALYNALSFNDGVAVQVMFGPTGP